ncbi:hypothetical protein Dhaf_3551 [Desulfitobacterium hafniense DCB-2]|uniref:Prepilin-type N-terminal cleavage/methylation domain-containing protein n=1 Tax=Desulfitobacterium hafniense (strain DSM 10664 / DCB-2) TaxID=272564 RepID=B8FQA8_DESHD|nr:prepilin-type N-terminal cleavage/methylation domain-containing protein [Desulfitobacterium hafniense]ACL21569.1 hypothetical protein Dhaf_3551 [Desulfitobacterium hafniense DCB-2]
MNKQREEGFTILEVMIAIVIFGILMMIISQLMRGEIRMLNTASGQDAIQQKARSAMVHLLDEVRLNRYVAYYAGDTAEGGRHNEGVYANEPGGTSRCLINIRPVPDVLNGDMSKLPGGTEIYYDYWDKKLWYRDTSTNEVHLIADEIDALTIQPLTEHLLQIHLKARSTSGTYEQELLTWIRMY